MIDRNTADVLFSGGRVIDPATGLDATTDVAVVGDRITAVGKGDLDSQRVVDVSGLVVAPGAIDLHSHSYTLAGHRLQALDGVTTVLELEGGFSPVGRAIEVATAEGRPLNFGFSASWAMRRFSILCGESLPEHIGIFLNHIGDPAWQRPASHEEVATLVGGLENDLADGALGIGVVVGYAPTTDPSEYLAVAELAAKSSVPTFTHARELIEADPHTLIDGAEEIVRAAGETGAHMHYCHINSTSNRHVDRVLGLVERAQNEGSRVTTEAYPYGAGTTGIGAAFLAPELLHRGGLTPQSIRYMRTGERVSDAARLRELRKQDPGGLAVIDILDENDPAQRALLHKSLLFKDTAVASDAVPLTWLEGEPQEDAWPLPSAAVTHPRTAGTFSKALRILTREHGVSLIDAIARTSYRPAQILESSITAFRTKGRVQQGCDADLVVFDPETISDQATYVHSTRPSIGIHHVMVNGQFVVENGELKLDARPGRPIRPNRR